MRGLLDRLFALDGLGFSDPESVLTFARPIPAWGWALILGGLSVLVGMSYVRQTADPRVRALLAGIRILLATMLLVLASGPQLQKNHERVEEDWVIMMLDRSRSMTIPDAPAASGRLTREAQLRAALADSADALRKVAAEKRVLWLGFDTGAFEIGSPLDDPAHAMLEPQGRATAIGASLAGALQRVAARPVSGVVLLSDGRSADQVDRAVLRSLEAQKIPVLSVPLGSAEPVADYAIRSVRGPDAVFVDDYVNAQVDVEQRGSGEALVRVELTDLDTEAVLDSADVRFDESGRASCSLSVRIDQPGRRRLGVRIVPQGEDLIADNNTAELGVEVVDRPLRVLYVDGYPRWEQRYIKNLLMREKSIRSSSLLLAANRRYLQEGDVEVMRLPRSVEEWAEYDVVILGDVRPELFGDEALEQLREHVADRGAGLIWIAGPGATPQGWRGSPLSDLIPIVLDTDRPPAAFDEPVTMARTGQAASLGLFGLQLRGESGAEESGWPAMLSDPATNWSRLRWAQKIDPVHVKPGAIVLATLTPVSAFGSSSGADTWPGVLLMRFGAGASVYVATDEIWRWRYGRGEDLPERFWVPLIRQLGRASVARSQRAVLLSATPDDALVGGPVRISVELLDQSLIDAQPSALRAAVVSADESLTRVQLDRQPDGRGRFLAGQWVPDRPGRFEVRLDDPLLPGVDASQMVRVSLPDDEARRPETDHALLAELAERTGGAVLTPEQLGQLDALLPNRELTIAGDPEIQPLWDRPIVLVVLLVLCSLEWVGRRLIRLA